MQQAPNGLTARQFRALAGNRQNRKKMKRAEWTRSAMERAARKS